MDEGRKELVIRILERIPKDILIKCADTLLFKKSKNPLEVELEYLTKSLRNLNLEDLESVMKRIREIKELLQHSGSHSGSQKSSSESFLIIPGAKYYEHDGIKYFSIEVEMENRKMIYQDLRAILKDNTLMELDTILIYLGIPESEFEFEDDDELNRFYLEDERNFHDYKFEDENYVYTSGYIAFKNQKLVRIRDLVKKGTSKPNCITRSQVPLRDYQVKVIQFINSPTEKSLLVVHGTGTGKTLSALTASQCYLDANPGDRVLVISPASLTGNFEKEMKKYGGRLSVKYSFYSFTKFTSLNKGSYKTPFDLYYEDEIEHFRDLHPDDSSDELRSLMAKEFNEIKKRDEATEGWGKVGFHKTDNIGEKYEPTTEYGMYKQRANEINIQNMYDCTNTMVIIDEAHNMRNMGAQYDAVFKCVAQSKKLLLLTATPFVNNLHDFTPLINMLYRDESIMKKGSRNKIPLKIISEDKYFKALETIYDMIRGKVTYLNEKSSEFFPSVKMHKKEIDMSPDFFKKYEKALVADRTFGDAPEVFYNGFRRAVNAVGAEEYLNQKLDIILELIREGRQTLVFTNWIEAGVSVLTQAFEENDITYLVISGEVPANTRLELVEKFNHKRVQVLIITLAGSEGLDLKEVRDVIILDPVWNPAVMEQIIGRAVRYKSHINLPFDDRRVDVYNLILKTPPDANVPSGDEILYAFIYEKQKQLNDVNKMLKNASI